jgi:hypothetical protein
MSEPVSVIVLSSRNTSRTQAFFQNWQDFSEVTISTIPGVYLDPSDAAHYNTDHVFRKIYHRGLTLQELGCSKAHETARSQIAESEYGGIIFEDDARFVEPDVIINVATDFLLKHRGKSRILNLCESPLSRFERGTLRKQFRIFGQSPLAVAYVLTPQAAKELNRANHLVPWVSDWPLSRVRHYICYPALVVHGDSGSGSEIALGVDGGDFRQNSLSFKLKIQRIMPTRLLQSVLQGFVFQYIYFSFLAPFLWRVDRLKTQLGKHAP